MTGSDIHFRLAKTVEARKQSDPDASYVAKLLHEGQDKILKKIAEESAEVRLASKDGDSAHVVCETADLWFHCLVLLAHHNLKLEDVLDELRRREGVSGIDEKAARKAGGITGQAG
jgi:phosphoribosyl-ATP pyrophosphohydrolase